MFRKSIALLCVSCLLWTSLVGAGHTWAAESTGAKAEKGESDGEERPKTTRTIEALDDVGWSIVDLRQIEGDLVVLSPLVGPEIDLVESHRYSLFHGRSVYNERVPLRLLDIAIPGLQTATFLKLGERVMVRIRYRSGSEIADRTMPVGDEDALRRLREYVEHFDEVRKGEYKIGFESNLPEDAEYPKYTDREVSFVERRTRAGITRRLPGGVVLKNGERIQGQLLPEFDDGTILVQSGLDAGGFRLRISIGSCSFEEIVPQSLAPLSEWVSEAPCQAPLWVRLPPGRRTLRSKRQPFCLAQYRAESGFSPVCSDREAVLENGSLCWVL